MEQSRETSDTFQIKTDEMATCVQGLDNLIRAEYNTSHNFLDYYAGKDNLSSVYNVRNQIFYGRRGTGKTHLLKALQEKVLLDEEKNFFSIYIDLRHLKPLMGEENPLYYALILFREICIEMFKCAYVNVPLIFKINEFDSNNRLQIAAKRDQVQGYLTRLNASLEHKHIESIDNLQFNIKEIRALEASLNISMNPEISAKAENSESKDSTHRKITYLSFADMTQVLSHFLDNIGVNNIFLLIDEWSEIPIKVQPYLSELLKRSLIPSKIVLKIAAIPNRTKLMQNKFGLEDGGDIFGYKLDNRYIYELETDTTKRFFNELLYNQLTLIDKNIFASINGSFHPGSTILNQFLATQALREILVGSAGIPRDFLSIFINSFKHYYNRTNSAAHITLEDVRAATIEWYELDKKRAVEANESARIMLDMIIKEVIIEKKRCHFILPERFETHEILNDLIDLRVIHFRKRGISHKDIKGVSYNVYYIDYACYTSSNIYHNKINNKLLEELKDVDNFRDIRRISLEEKFFDNLNTELGYGFKCPHCGDVVDTRHPAYTKQSLCNRCFEKVVP